MFRRLFSKSRRPSARPPRGYLMLEQLMAGGILAATAAVAAGTIANARVEISRSGQRATASSLAAAKAAELAADEHIVNTGGVTITANGVTYTNMNLDSLSAFPADFEMWFKVENSGIHTNSTPNLASSDELHEATVVVRYRDVETAAHPDGLRYIVYKRYKRKQF